MNFAILGHGTVGQAHKEAAEHYGHTCVCVIDPPKGIDEGDIHEALLAFVCVPTPAKPDGSCDRSAVFEAVGLLAERRYRKTVVIRSFCRKHPICSQQRLATFATTSAPDPASIFFTSWIG